MGDDASTTPAQAEADRELEREIRQARPFSIEEALGRLAGPGGLKGASPVSRLQQAQAVVAGHLRRHLADPAGALRTVLTRVVGEGQLLLDHMDRPLAALAGQLRQLLGSDEGLADLVREADVEWGRVMGERPCFERAGQAPATDDPYTLVSVRRALDACLAGLDGA